MSDIIESIREELIQSANEKAKLSAERYFKGGIKLYGVITPEVSRISKSYFKNIEDKSKSNIFPLCEELWKSGFVEESIVACQWAYNIHREYIPVDFKVFDNWVKNYLNNWASCDTLCNHAVGTFVEMFPEYLTSLKEWAKSENRWVKRASAVSLIIPARNGMFLQDIFEIADILHLDKDDMVQKGYGWMLKAASQANQDEVFYYVMKRKATMPRTSLRYAIEKMSPELKAQVMLK
ncbi:MAG TPA: DNA alkylation repair protein [Bacteroidales bacterium]|nr:DNA alkylation repair protein [Bacteroidales bacterium]